jgi:hypothetical protein
VFQASRAQAPNPNPSAQAAIGEKSDIEIIDKKDPILLALEKET